MGISGRGLLGGLLKEMGIPENELRAHIEVTWALPEKVEALIDITDWYRGGAETYVAHSQLLLSTGLKVDFFGKAFVGMGISPERQQDRWEKRRASFADAGIRVPFLYAKYPALSVEEYIPDTLPTGRLGPIFSYQLGMIVSRLQAMKLQTLSLLSDVRVTRNEIVYVDLGTDIATESDGDWHLKFSEKLAITDRAAFRAGMESYGLAN